VIADVDSPLSLVAGVTLSAIRGADPSRTLELARNLYNTGRPTARMSVARAYGWRLAAAPVLSTGEFNLIRMILASDDVEVALELSHGLRFIAERNPRMAILAILDMKIGRSEKIVREVVRLFTDSGPLAVSMLTKEQLNCIVAQVIECNQIDDYWIQEFISALSHTQLPLVVRLLQGRVEYAERLDELGAYRAVPHRWHDEWRLDSRGARDRRRILEEMRDWAAEHGAPVIYSALANAFDDEALAVIEDGLKLRVEIAENVASLLSQVPREFVWSHVQWIVRTLEDAERRDIRLYQAVGDTLQSALRSGVRSGKPGEPFPEDVMQCDRARTVADGLPSGSPGERFYRSLQRAAEQAIEWKRDWDEDRDRGLG
jgi:hypothetical protein